MGKKGAFQQQAGESVTRGDGRRRVLEARSPSPPLACLLLESFAASGGKWWSQADGFKSATILDSGGVHASARRKSPTDSAEEAILYRPMDIEELRLVYEGGMKVRS